MISWIVLHLLKSACSVLFLWFNLSFCQISSTFITPCFFNNNNYCWISCWWCWLSSDLYISIIILQRCHSYPSAIDVNKIEQILYVMGLLLVMILILLELTGCHWCLMVMTLLIHFKPFISWINYSQFSEILDQFISHFVTW